MIVEAEMILIKNARVMDPESGFDQVTDILLDGKRIRQIGMEWKITKFILKFV